MANIKKRSDLPSIIRYLGDDFPNYYQFLVENPPFFNPASLELSNYSLTFRYDISEDCYEEELDYLNRGLKINKDYNPYVFFEIKNKRKHASIRVPLPSFDIYVAHIKERTSPPKNQFELLHSQLLRLVEPHDELFARDTIIYFDFSQNKLLIAHVPHDGPIDENESMGYTIYPLITDPPSAFKPGEVITFGNWTYDPPINLDNTSNMTGASMTLTYQHFRKDGTLNPSPWRIRIKNYSLKPKHTKTNVAYEQSNLTDLSCSLSNQHFGSLVSRINTDIRIHNQYLLECATYFEYLQELFPTSELISKYPIDNFICSVYGK